MKFVPIYDRVLVRVLPRDARIRSGLYIPQMATDNTPYLKSEVIAVGQGRITSSGAVVPLVTKVGDIVLFFRNPASGEQLAFPSDVPGEELWIIRESNIAGTIEDLDKVTSIVGLDGGNLELPS